MQVGGTTRPHRVRVLDLPFTAVEWVLPTELSASLPATPTKWMVWQRSPRAVMRVSSGLPLLHSFSGCHHLKHILITCSRLTSVCDSCHREPAVPCFKSGLRDILHMHCTEVLDFSVDALHLCHLCICSCADSGKAGTICLGRLDWLPSSLLCAPSGIWDVDDTASGGGTPLGGTGGKRRGSGAGEVGDAEGDEYPEERLAFALGDGRVGVLAVKGRKVG